MDTRHSTPTAIEQILDDFEFLDNWEDRYRYVIELGRDLEPFNEAWRTAENKVQGCVSQVWLHGTLEPGPGGTHLLRFTGDSDAHIVRGLIAILLALFSGRRTSDIIAQEATPVFERLGLKEHLTPQRSNGLFAMVERIKRDAHSMAAEA